MTHHTLDPGPDTLHGTFDPSRPPALTIDPGDTVQVSTLDVAWGLTPHPPASADDSHPPRTRYEPREDGPAMCGPIAVRGAEPGMAMVAHVLEVIPCAWGWTWAGDNGLNSDMIAQMGFERGKGALLCWELDPDRMIATSELGHEVPLDPFMGTLGLCPGEPGVHPGWFPRRTGGNMDYRGITAGSSLVLPIEAPGGLLSLGDGHARQGDGEVAGSAIECRMARVTLHVELRDDLGPLPGPLNWTKEGWTTLAFHRDLNQAAAEATRAMVDRVARALDVEPLKALALASPLVDLRVTQIANEVCGAHAFLPHGALDAMPEARP